MKQSEQARKQFEALEAITKQGPLISIVKSESAEKIATLKKEFFEEIQRKLSELEKIDSESRDDLVLANGYLFNARKEDLKSELDEKSLLGSVNALSDYDERKNILFEFGKFFLYGKINSALDWSFAPWAISFFLLIFINGVLFRGIEVVLFLIIINLTIIVGFFTFWFFLGKKLKNLRDTKVKALHEKILRFSLNDLIFKRKAIENLVKVQEGEMLQFEKNLLAMTVAEEHKLQSSIESLQTQSRGSSQQLLRGQIDWAGLQKSFSSIPASESAEGIATAKRSITKEWVLGLHKDLREAYPTGVPALWRAGVAGAQFQEHAFSFTAGFPLEQTKLVLHKASGRAAAVAGVQNLVARALTSIAAGQLKLLFIDPLGLGQNAAMFMKLTEFDETLVSTRVWGEPQHIEARLAEITEHMENVIQKYLRNEYADILAYNAQAPVPEPLRLVVIFDFPTNFSESSARRLVSIAQNGARCGVYTLILVDMDKPLPYGFNLADLKQDAFMLEQHNNGFAWQGLDPNIVQFKFDDPPPPDILNALLEQIGMAAKEASKIEVPFEKIAKPQADWWRSSTGESVKAILGPSGARTLQELEFGRGTAHHGLIAGRTGSGKSTLLHALITSLATAYSPAELELYLIDFKEGVEFKRYALHSLPHARVVAIESEREFGVSVLQGLDKLIVERGDLFKRLDAKNLLEARAKYNQPIPRALLLVDEFQVFFQEDDRLSSEAMTLIDRIVRQGRSFGVHVLFGSQSLAGSASLPRPIMDQMGVRIALQCSDADSRIILADDNPQARLLSRPGEAIYNDKNGLLEGNNRFQVAFLRDEVQEQMLAQISQGAKEAGWTRVPIVFEGNAPAVFESKFPLSEQIMGAWQAPAKRLLGLIGEPIAIKAATAVGLKRQSGHNVLFIGQDESLTTAMLTTTLFSLATQLSPKDAHFWVVDFTATEDGAVNPLETLQSSLPHSFKLGKRRELPQFLTALSSELNTRMELEGSSSGLASHFLVIAGAARARDLRPDENAGYGLDESAPESPALQLAKLLREGPELGLHTMITCDTLMNLNRTLERRSLSELDIRVVLQMSSEDSSSLIDSPVANKLGANRALLYSIEEGKLEKFRPYRIPDSAWLGQIGGFLKNKQL